MPKPGYTYQHFKHGTLYTVLHIATHSETQETLVIYIQYGGSKVWARPLDSWQSLAPGGDRLRFVEVEELNNDLS